MWIIAFFGIATIYAEAVLAQKTRIKSKSGEVLGGPALGFFGCMVQANAVALFAMTGAVGLIFRTYAKKKKTL